MRALLPLWAVEQVFGGIGFFYKEDSTRKGGTVQLISSSHGGEGGGGDGGLSELSRGNARDDERLSIIEPRSADP